MFDYDIGIEDPRSIEKEFSTLLSDLGKLVVYAFVAIFAMILINLNISWLLRHRGT